MLKSTKISSLVLVAVLMAGCASQSQAYKEGLEYGKEYGIPGFMGSQSSSEWCSSAASFWGLETATEQGQFIDGCMAGVASRS